MLCHYTAARKLRKKDNYTPGGIMGKRSDHATVVYSKLARKFGLIYQLLSAVLKLVCADLLIMGVGKQVIAIHSY